MENIASHRERKKLLLRENLIEAAYQHFVEKGFDTTTVKDITTLVNVSSRTFFRYFTCKEDVVLDYEMVEYEEIIMALSVRPKTEPIITALRKASVSVTKSCEEGAFGIDPKRFRTLRDLIRNHPNIRAKSIELLQKKKARLISLIAQKIGTSSTQDIRPQAIATTLEFVYSSAYDIWKERAEDETFYDVLDEVFSLIEAGINYSCVK